MHFATRLLPALLFVTSTTFARAEVPEVVTDIPPVHTLVAQVMGDLGMPVLLLERGADPHHFQLRPSQARALANATLVIWAGPGIAPWLESAMGAGSGERLVLNLSTPESSEAHPIHTDEETHRHEDAHHHEDPHSWLDPENALDWLSHISEALSEADPQNAPIYSANAQAARARIETLDQEIRAELATSSATARTPGIIVLHDAYSHFSAHYGVHIAGVVRDGDATPAGARHLRDLRQLAQETGVRCLFGEPGESIALLEVIAEGTDAQIGELDPLGNLITPGPELYEELLRNMVRSIIACTDQ